MDKNDKKRENKSDQGGKGKNLFLSTVTGGEKGGFLFALIFFSLFFLFASNLYSFDNAVTSPERQYQYGVLSYEHGDYDTAVTYLTMALKGRLKTDQKKKVLEILGIIYFIKKDRNSSRRYFERLLDMDPDYSLDPLFVPPEIIIFFNELKQKKRSILTTVGQHTVTEKRETPGFLKTTAMLLPFGIGYAVKKEKTKAIFFGILEGFLMATNVSLYYYRNCALKPCGDRYYPPDKVGEANTLQTIQLVAGYLFVGLWGYNIVDIFGGK